MQIDYLTILEFVVEIIVFLILMIVCRFIFDKLENSSYKLLNPREYLPEEEVHSLRQMSFLIMMALLFISVLYNLVYIGKDLLSFVIFDILISLYIATKLDKRTWKNRILLILLIPYGSLTYFLFGKSLVGYIALIHIPVFIYFIKVYYDKFREYTESNGLGIAIILLFTIIFVSFFITQLAEQVNPLNALVMVSNAFTSNGYAVLGTTAIGKINSIFLVWGGYILSGVGTATLAAAILKKHHDVKNKELYDKIDELDKKIDNLEELIKKNNNDDQSDL
ncbi:hypothetical protein [uncultured Methanobrevibacter sp.]|uniref:hypothetical protein n=1 Tax=uncultured Methanobrevibacter sp. TaxID=253161 RepID=UPI0025E82EAE|nr:hypothetical protein [uncultured Methanobrevibacter sp.]